MLLTLIYANKNFKKYGWFTMLVYRFIKKSAHMVSFGQHGQIILFHKSARGIKTTEILLRINILNKRRTYAGTLNLYKQKIVVIV